MKPRFPLYAKILVWFFLNLLVVGSAIVVLLRYQFNAGPELLLDGPAGERLRAVGQLVSDELNARPPAEWTSLLDRFGNAYRVRFLLFRNSGGQLAGESTTLPRNVAQRVFAPPGPGRREGRPPRDPVPAPPDLPLSRPSVRPPVRDIFLVGSTDPRQYWIGFRTGLADRDGNPRNPATILLVTDSLTNGGLFVDVKPFVWVGAGVILFSVLFWLPLVRSITRSIRQVSQATSAIAEGRFEVRVNAARRDELGLLGHAINRMASRLAGFVTGQKRFLGDIAHELCSPIARLQMALGILEQRADPKDKAYVDDMREEMQLISGLVGELLSFSKASLGATHIKLQPLALRPLVEKAAKREVREGVEILNEVPEQLTATADPELIVRALSNLLRNAVRYAASAGPIKVTGQAGENQTELTVHDCGPGVPESELTKLFDPFYRVDTSRARETGGTGLGLSIVKTCVESCHGSVTCRNGEGGGFQAIITLPA